MDIPTILFAIAMLHAGYLIQLCFRQPSSKKVITSSESRLMWFFVSPDNMMVVRTGAFCLCLHHALVSMIIAPAVQPGDGENQLLNQVCPVPEYLDRQLFTWSRKTVLPLLLLYAGSYVRFQAYAQLGMNFTYRLAKPDGLVTDGLYAYVRHPSYTGLFGVLIALYTLFLHQHGLVSCWVPAVLPSLGRQMVTDAKFAYFVPVVSLSTVTWLVMMKRVQEEERMMEREFEQAWRDYCKTTTKFIPFVL